MRGELVVPCCIAVEIMTAKLYDIPRMVAAADITSLNACLMQKNIVKTCIALTNRFVIEKHR